MASAKIGSRKNAFGEGARRVSMISAKELRKFAVGDDGKARHKSRKELAKRGLPVELPVEEVAADAPDVV